MLDFTTSLAAAGRQDPTNRLRTLYNRGLVYIRLKCGRSTCAASRQPASPLAVRVVRSLEWRRSARALCCHLLSVLRVYR